MFQFHTAASVMAEGRMARAGEAVLRVYQAVTGVPGNVLVKIEGIGTTN